MFFYIKNNITDLNITNLIIFINQCFAEALKSQKVGANVTFHFNFKVEEKYFNIGCYFNSKLLI